MQLGVDVLDLGINNLASLCRALREVGGVDVRTVASAGEATDTDLLILPGVGAYGAAMRELDVRGLVDVVRDHVGAGKPLLGVCLGMQLLGDTSEESPGVSGLGLIPATVTKLTATGDVRVPNMGWSSLEPAEPAQKFPTLLRAFDFYFVHSYAMVPSEEDDVLVRCAFGQTAFVAGVLRDNVLGLQFHPEKSSRGGLQLLTDVVAWAHG
jgi:glutamine amidotransferase